MRAEGTIARPVLSVIIFSRPLQAVWKKQEDKELMIIAKTHNFCNWTLIATELGVSLFLDYSYWVWQSKSTAHVDAVGYSL